MDWIVDITMCARILKSVEADSKEEAQQKAEEMIGNGSERKEKEFCESVRDQLMLCEPEICDLYED